MNRIKDLFNKYKEIILYVFFGALTTLVNFAVYFFCKSIGIGYEVSTVIAWVAAVLFAFVTNKKYVFENRESGVKIFLKQMLLFFGGRLFSLGLELLIMKIGMDCLNAGELTVVLFSKQLPLGEFITKTTAQIVVLITNYLISKLLIFKKKKEKTDENSCD